MAGAHGYSAHYHGPRGRNKRRLRRVAAGTSEVYSGPVVFQRYLDVLGQPHAPPSLGALSALVQAQLSRVPFENISKLLARKRGARWIPTLSEHLDGVERHGFGGTCYANNPYFYELLAHLGYDVTLCAADMSEPEVHIVSLVRLAGREYLVDVGYAAPFFAPLPRDLEVDHVIRFGDCTYVLEPRDPDGCSRLRMSRRGKAVHGYRVNPRPRVLSDLRAVIESSYRDHATFMNAVVVERFHPGGSLRIHNLTLTETRGARSTTTALAGPDQLVDAITHHAGMPAPLVREAIAGVKLAGDIYS